MAPTVSSSVGVAGALAGGPAVRTASALFSLENRVALVTGGHRGIGLEMALALAEAGAVVYCLDLPSKPDSDWLKVQAYAANLPDLETGKKGRLEYVSGDVTDQKAIAKEGFDVCMANAGILHGAECLDYTAEDFRKAAGRQMERLGIPGSIILTASMSGTITNPNQHWVAYNTSKSAVLQMARSLACELAPKRIRVNSISPGYIFTNMTGAFLETQPPGFQAVLGAQNPMNRFGRPDELRGVTLWLASDASTFCTGSDIKVDGGQCAW
ncbi:hypothetical protein C8J57DRAFT_1322308 [Mycena rebaudengoi]|nr:hypothetical protein C8J57DRAFT_1322308 [Mycena rebaudengoi]